MGLEIDIDKIDIDKKQVLKFLGYAKKKAAAIILRKIDEEIESVKKLYKVKVFLKQFSIDKNGNGKIDFGGYSISSSYVSEKLEGMDTIYLSIYTLGDSIEYRIDEYSHSSEMIRALILDKIGIVALDNMKEQIKEKINKRVEPLKVSTELYPAQKDFHISNQKIFYEVFKEMDDMVGISENYQFYPIKTVAVIFGIGKNLEENDMCSNCEKKCY